MTPDRPTGPATLTEEDRIRREFLDELVASGVVSTPLMPFAEIKETLARFERRYRFAIEAEQKARILAALPEALHSIDFEDGHEPEGPLAECPAAEDYIEQAAALAAAIERLVG